MSTAELKLDTLNNYKIKEVCGLIVNYINKTGPPDFWDELSETEKKQLMKA
jgi:hypothetical protein